MITMMIIINSIGQSSKYLSRSNPNSGPYNFVTYIAFPNLRCRVPNPLSRFKLISKTAQYMYLLIGRLRPKDNFRSIIIFTL